MDFLIRSIDFTSSGREIVREREVSAPGLVIGRASESDIHLPDLAVEQHHARLEAKPSGSLGVEAIGTLGFGLDGRTVKRGAIDPRRGGELAFGTYRLDVEEGENGRTLIVIRQVSEDAGEIRDRLRGFGVESAMPSRRAISWVALVGILIAFLALPVWSHLTRDESVDPTVSGEGAVLMDASWSTGDLSMVHHGLEDNCEACHVEPFQAVQDKTCLTCHEDIGDHAEADRMAKGMHQPEGGDAFLWDVAQFFGKPGPGACTDCHTEHEGAGKMEPTAQQFCSDCHEALDGRLSDTTLGNANDFGDVHPEFKALIRPSRDSDEIRMTLAADSTDFNGLKFPHDMHLSKTNGVAKMAMNLKLGEDGGALACASCHTPRADGVSFLPVVMEDSCEDCHSLVYDKVGNMFRTLRHGDIEQVEADLLAADRNPRRPVSVPRRRPGQFAEGGVYYGNFSRVMPGGLSRSALNEDGVCGECHYPAADAGGRLAVEPVVQRSRYFQHGWFDHEDHKQEECSSCHEAGTSKAANDLLLPDLESCRDCHLGESAVEAEVPSSCAMCHSYHPRTGPAAAPPRIASRQR